MVPARLFFACNRAPAPTGLSSAAAEHNIQLRRMAEAEPIAAIRAELLAVARQYQQLADGLKTGAPFSDEALTEPIEPLGAAAAPGNATGRKP